MPLPALLRTGDRQCPAAPPGAAPPAHRRPGRGRSRAAGVTDSPRRFRETATCTKKDEGEGGHIMSDGLLIAYLLEGETAYRNAVVYPATTRRAQLERDLQQLRHDAPARLGWRTPARGLGVW